MAEPKWSIKLDVNKAAEQMASLAGKLWDKLADPSTAIVVELMNESKYDLRHVGDYRWQGNFREPAADVLAGYGRVYGMLSKGLDGCFGFSCYELWDGDEGTGVYFVIGSLVYWDGAQPHYTALLTDSNVYNEGKPEALSLLGKGKSAAWTEDYDVKDIQMTIKVDIWRGEISAIAENFRVQMTPAP